MMEIYIDKTAHTEDKVFLMAALNIEDTMAAREAPFGEWSLGNTAKGKGTRLHFHGGCWLRESKVNSIEIEN